MPDVTVNVDVLCGRCGDVLSNQTESMEGYQGAIELHVEPCEKCLDAAKNKGYDLGLEEAESEEEDE